MACIVNPFQIMNDANCGATSKPKKTLWKQNLLQMYILFTIFLMSLICSIRSHAGYTEEELRSLSKYTQISTVEQEFFQNPTPITFSKIDPKKREPMLAEMLAVGPVVMDAAGLSIDQVAQRYEQIFKAHLIHRSPEKLRSIYYQAFEQIVMNPNESRESSEQLGQRASHLLLLSSQGDRQALQDQFCKGFLGASFNLGAKEGKGFADFSGVNNLEYTTRLLNVILSSVGNQLNDDCKVTVEENGKKETATFTLSGSLRTISPVLIAASK